MSALKTIYTKHVRPPGYYVDEHGAEWSIATAARTGRVMRDGKTAGNIYCGAITLPGEMWVQTGRLDEEAVRYVLALEECRDPQPPAETVTRRVSEQPQEVPFDQHSPEGRAVVALLAFLESPMENSDKVTLAKALRGAVRGICGISR